MTDLDILKKNTAKISVLSNLSLIIMKFIAGFVTGSFSIISEALHSATDLLAAYVAYFAVKKSAKSADEDHPFGHGKYEDFSGLIEGVLINIAAIYIIFEAGRKIIMQEHAIMNIDIAAGVMILSVVVNIFVSQNLFRVAKKTGSIALYADGEHLRVDVYTSLGVALGMLLIKFTGIHILDSLIALIVAVMISHTGMSICKKAVGNLLDEGLPEADVNEIREIVNSFKDDGVYGVSKIRTRTSGPRKNIELVVYVKGSMTVKESHDICNKIEAGLRARFNQVDTMIHIEPKSDIMSKSV